MAPMQTLSGLKLPVSGLMVGYCALMVLLTLATGGLPENTLQCTANLLCQAPLLWQSLFLITALGFSFLFWLKAVE